MDAIVTKTETTSPSNVDVTEPITVDPTTVECPECGSHIGGKCYSGSSFVEWFHLARVEAATKAVQRPPEPQPTDTGPKPEQAEPPKQAEESSEVQ